MSRASDTPDPGPEKQALSFGKVAEAYHRARPSYPEAAVTWLLDRAPIRVVELGAGTGKLTAVVQQLGHDVVATDPSAPMLRQMDSGLRCAVSTAEAIPVRSRSVDAVVCGQSFHRFDLDLAFPEIARVLKPGGVLAIAHNVRDESIPWVRRLGRLLPDSTPLPMEQLLTTPHFGLIEEQTFRFWQTHTAASLRDLVLSRSGVAILPEEERTELLGQVQELYDGYGRGFDGMRLPYVSHCYRAVVQHQEEPPEVPERSYDVTVPPSDGAPEDTGTLLIDFR